MNFLELFKKKHLIAAHRGVRSLAPENTLSAIKASVGHCDFVEVDVQLSSDGVAIIIHDETLNRTTNASGRVSDFTFEELSLLDYGSWFDGEKEPILPLSKLLKFIKKQRLFLNIEIKDMHKFFSDEKVISTVFKEIRAWHVEELVLLSSFRSEYLPLCKEKIPNIPTALLVEKKHPKKLIEYLKELKVDAYHMSNKLVDRESVAKLRKAGFFVNIYTINDFIRAKELFDMGVNGIFSDKLIKK
ncbi:MAG: glycerophosphodiester phosphodiesterase family protein [Campylobacterota bacterium]|nr:glycerophosphodiester phosphodiesterase family protein [Campylobacterota bacterium]